jgi:hypothetical protein
MSVSARAPNEAMSTRRLGESSVSPWCAKKANATAPDGELWHFSCLSAYQYGA